MIIDTKYWRINPDMVRRFILDMKNFVRGFNYCYESVQSFRVTCLFTGQYNTKGYSTITEVLNLFIWDL